MIYRGKQDRFLGHGFSVSKRHYLCYILQVQLPLNLLCYDLSRLSMRVTGDMYMSQVNIHNCLVAMITIKSSFLLYFKITSGFSVRCNPSPPIHWLYFDLTFIELFLHTAF
jgi:hypothetical protein